LETRDRRRSSPAPQQGWRTVDDRSTRHHDASVVADASGSAAHDQRIIALRGCASAARS
jgi:hypothetical protein